MSTRKIYKICSVLLQRNLIAIAYKVLSPLLPDTPSKTKGSRICEILPFTECTSSPPLLWSYHYNLFGLELVVKMKGERQPPNWKINWSQSLCEKKQCGWRKDFTTEVFCHICRIKATVSTVTVALMNYSEISIWLRVLLNSSRAWCHCYLVCFLRKLLFSASLPLVYLAGSPGLKHLC